MEVVNEVVAMVRLDNLEEINTVRNALHKIVQAETSIGYKQRLLLEEEREALQDIASSLVGYSQVNEPPQQLPPQPQYKVVAPQAIPQGEEEERVTKDGEQKRKSRKKGGS